MRAAFVDGRADGRVFQSSRTVASFATKITVRDTIRGIFNLNHNRRGCVSSNKTIFMDQKIIKTQAVNNSAVNKILTGNIHTYSTYVRVHT